MQFIDNSQNYADHRKSANIKIEKASYLPGETIKAVFPANTLKYNNIKISNINIDISKIQNPRTIFLISQDSKPRIKGTEVSVEIKLPDNLQPGLYCLGNIRLIYGENILTNNFSEIFYIRTSLEPPYSKEKLQEIFSRVRIQKQDSLHTELIANSEGKSTFRVFVFCSGSLIHSIQDFKGFQIIPVKKGITNIEKYNIAMEHMRSLGIDASLPIAEVIEINKNSDEVFVISYYNIRANNDIEAANFCRAHTDKILLLLAHHNAGLSKRFLTISNKRFSNTLFPVYDINPYLGNLATAFEPQSLAIAIERNLDISEYKKTLIKNFYSDQYEILRYWSILELMAKKYCEENIPIVDMDDNYINHDNGQHVTTSSKEARVYHYIKNNLSYKTTMTIGTGERLFMGYQNNPNHTDKDTHISLWEMVTAIYGIRNSLVHSGQFPDPHPTIKDQKKIKIAQQFLEKASQGYSLFDPFIFCKELATEALSKELHQST